VGAPVQRLPEGPAVGAEASGERSSFGAWYRRQRELRGISLFYVAARTKLTPERVREIEEAAQLGVPQQPQLVRRPRFPYLRYWSLRVGRRAGLALALALGVWLLGLWLSSMAPTASARPHVVKPDYVEKLLHRE